MLETTEAGSHSESAPLCFCDSTDRHRDAPLLDASVDEHSAPTAVVDESCPDLCRQHLQDARQRSQRVGQAIHHLQMMQTVRELDDGIVCAPFLRDALASMTLDDVRKA